MMPLVPLKGRLRFNIHHTLKDSLKSLREYSLSVRSKKFLPQDDQRLINSKSFDYCIALSQVRNFWENLMSLKISMSA